VSITTKVLNLNPAHGEVYSVQHYVKGFSVTCGRFVLFSRYSVSSTNKTDHHDITEILLKVAPTNKTDRHDITEILLKVALSPHQ